MGGIAQLYARDINNPNADGTYNFIPVDGVGGAASVATTSVSTNAYGAHPANLGDKFTGIIGAADNNVVYTSPPVIYANNILIECTAGIVDVEISTDGTNWRLATLRTITAAGVVVNDDIEIASGEHGVLNESDIGKFSQFRILQKGAVASNARGRYGVA